ncbi:7050_t:CDS:2, partial [Cetraspora pellucida]
SIAQQQRRARENSAATSECDKNNRKYAKLDNTICTQYEQHNIGQINIECIHCNALHWLDECLTSSSCDHSKFSTCCSQGQYNAAHAFTSLGAKIDQSVFNDHGPYGFRISGKLYHHMSSLLPNSDAEAAYTQLYIYNSEIAHQLRIE